MDEAWLAHEAEELEVVTQTIESVDAFFERLQAQLNEVATTITQSRGVVEPWGVIALRARSLAHAVSQPTWSGDASAAAESGIERGQLQDLGQKEKCAANLRGEEEDEADKRRGAENCPPEPKRSPKTEALRANRLRPNALLSRKGHSSTVVQVRQQARQQTRQQARQQARRPVRRPATQLDRAGPGVADRLDTSRTTKDAGARPAHSYTGLPMVARSAPHRPAVRASISPIVSATQSGLIGAGPEAIRRMKETVLRERSLSRR